MHSCGSDSPFLCVLMLSGLASKGHKLNLTCTYSHLLMKLRRIPILVSLLVLRVLAFSQTEVVLQLNHTVDGQSFFLGQTYEVDSTQVSFDRMQYYMCDFVVTHDGGQETALIDKYILVNANDNEVYSLGEWDIQSVESVSFGIGVDSAHNVGIDPTTYPPGHPLAPQQQSMHWGWASGYRFLAFEGYSGDGLSNQSQVHALGDVNFFHQSHVVSGESIGDALVLTLEADYAHLFVDLPLDNGFFVHGTFGAAAQMMANMRDSVFEPGTAARIEAPVASEIRIFPSPTTDFICLRGVHFTEAKQWVIYDAAGKWLLEGMVSANEHISVQHLLPGVYHMVIQDTRGTSIAAHRFLKL